MNRTSVAPDARLNMQDKAQLQQRILLLKQEKESLEAKKEELRSRVTSAPHFYVSKRNIMKIRLEMTETEVDAFMQEWNDVKRAIREKFDQIGRLEEQVKKLEHHDVRSERARIFTLFHNEGLFTMETKRFGKLYFSYESEYPRFLVQQGDLTWYTKKNREFFEKLDAFPQDQQVSMLRIEGNEPYYDLLAFDDLAWKRHVIPLPVFLESMQNKKYKALLRKEYFDDDGSQLSAWENQQKALKECMEEAQSDFKLSFEYEDLDDWQQEKKARFESEDLNDE